MSLQFKRRATLQLRSATQVLDLSELRFVFRLQQSDFDSPNTASVTVFNVKDETAWLMVSEFAALSLSAGYEGAEAPFAEIFNGTVKQSRRGRVMAKGATETYVELSAADGDAVLLNRFVTGTLQSGMTSQEQQFEAIRKGAALPAGYVMDLPASALSRGKVLYGMASDYFRAHASNNGARHSIQKGKINLVPEDSFIPTSATVLSAATGLLGIPEVTPEGIKIKCLLNPSIVVGGVIQLNNRDVKDFLLSGGLLRLSPEELAQYRAATVPKVPEGDGFYKVLVAEHSGDTRGQAWHTDITALALTGDPARGKVKVKAHARP